MWIILDWIYYLAQWSSQTVSLSHSDFYFKWSSTYCRSLQIQFWSLPWGADNYDLTLKKQNKTRTEGVLWYLIDYLLIKGASCGVFCETVCLDISSLLILHLSVLQRKFCSNHPFEAGPGFTLNIPALRVILLWVASYPGDHELPAVFSFEGTVSLSVYYNFSFKYSLFMHLIHLILTVKQINGPLVESLGTLI